MEQMLQPPQAEVRQARLPKYTIIKKNQTMNGAACIDLEKSALGAVLKQDWEASKKSYSEFVGKSVEEYTESRSKRGIGKWQTNETDVRDALVFLLSKLNGQGITIGNEAMLMSQFLQKKERNCETSCFLCADFLAGLGMKAKDMAILIFYSKDNENLDVGHAILRVFGTYFDVNKASLIGYEPNSLRKVASPYMEYRLDNKAALNYQVICSAISRKCMEKGGEVSNDPKNFKLQSELNNLIELGIDFSTKAQKMRPNDWMIGTSMADFQLRAMTQYRNNGQLNDATVHANEAYKAVNKVLSLNPELVLCYLLRAEILQASSRYLDALKDYQYAYDRMPPGHKYKEATKEKIEYVEKMIKEGK